MKKGIKIMFFLVFFITVATLATADTTEVRRYFKTSTLPLSNNSKKVLRLR